MKTKTIFTCQSCGYQSPRWLGKCPDCDKWNTFAEEDYAPPPTAADAKNRMVGGDDPPVLLEKVALNESGRVKTGIQEFDRVLGGGIVEGSVVLIGGDPGIGKSTICLQVCRRLTGQGHTVLYVSAEESVTQTKLRASRLGAGKESERLYIVNQTDVSRIIEYVKKLKPKLLIVDSIQVIFDPGVGSSPGSVSQVRECSGVLTQLAKKTGTAVFIVGHVTKEGTLAGPRVLEHIVDTVLYFEGDRFTVYRVLRAVKNRFGSTNEIGVFEMDASGLKEVENPSQIFLAERPKQVSGSVVAALIEGSRPLLVEIQALVSRTTFGYPARRSQGFDSNRLGLLVAVLEKRIGLQLESEDIFVNVVGGIKADDPAADLSVATAVASAFLGKQAVFDAVILGEVGLAGEVRSISQAAARVNEAEKLGFKKCVLPKSNCQNLEYNKNKIEIVPVSTVKETLGIVLV